MDFLVRYKWIFLSGCSLVVFSLLVIAVMAVMNLEATPGADQILVSSIPPTTTREPATDTPVLLPTAIPQPTETFVELPAREIAFVRRVIDGDTIEVILDGKPYRLRYIGLDAPEIGMPFSTEATEANRRLVENQIVELERDVSETDQYGRLLRYVYLQDGTMVNAELVKSGYAIALVYPPDTKYQDLINASQLAAKENNLGLWATPTATVAVAPQDSVIQILVDPACSQFNAPGNDNENKNEEYVCIANNGSGAVDFAGWSMKDQYGWTYQFPAYTLEAGSKVKIRSGCGDDSQFDLYWCKDETAVWNNDGDCVYLLNNEGELITEYCY